MVLQFIASRHVSGFREMRQGDQPEVSKVRRRTRRWVIAGLVPLTLGWLILELRLFVLVS